MRGSFVITPATPAATTRASSAGSSTVQASTGSPAALARRDRALGHEPVLEHDGAGPGAAGDPREAHRHRRPQRREPERDDRPQVRPPGDRQPVLRIGDPDPDTGRRAGDGLQARDMNAADDGAPFQAVTRIAVASSSSLRRSLRSMCSPTSGASSTKNASASSNVGRFGATARSASSDRPRTVPPAAPWLTSSR